MRPEVAVYYFPNYHTDDRNQKLHGLNWTEWELLKRAEPRFKGHNQPKYSDWGMEDESDPLIMAKKVDAAADHGIDTFIFDWYWYNDGPFLERALHEGFLNAKNNDRLKFALMWANHDWVDIHPMKACDEALKNGSVLYPGAVNKKTFKKITEICLGQYFKHSSYWLLDGCPYFSIYELNKFIEGIGSLEEAKEELDNFRAAVKAEGFKDLHLNAVVWTSCFLPGESQGTDVSEIISYLGFDSVTSYVWIHHFKTDVFPTVSYNIICDAYLDYWEEAACKYTLPYYPNVTMGWDASPRTVQSDSYDNRGYPFMYVIEDNSPQNFKRALSIAKDRVSSQNIPTPFLTINAWNEWTEGSYLEPDTVNGMAYLEAIRDVFELKKESNNQSRCEHET